MLVVSILVDVTDHDPAVAFGSSEDDSLQSKTVSRIDDSNEVIERITHVRLHLVAFSGEGG